MIPSPALKEVINKKGFAVGSWLNSASPQIAEEMSYLGFDFLTIDAEHSSVDTYQTQLLIQAIEAGNRKCSPLVRLPANNPSIIGKYMDLGAAGVVVPLVMNAEETRNIVKSVKYPPTGSRGVGFARSNMYGIDIDNSLENDNSRSFVCIQIEHISAVNNLNRILTVKDLDAVMIGPYDLSASMGIPGDLANKKLLKVQNKILKACQKHKIFAGIHVVKPSIEETANRIKEGYQFVAFSLDITIISETAKKVLSKINRLS